MALSDELISAFVEVTNDKTETKQETTVYGTIVEHDGTKYVRLDGSDLLTPISTTSSVKSGDRVTVLIKNHTATVTGNASDPSASTETVKHQGDQISEFEIIVSYKVKTDDLEAISAYIEDLRATLAKVDKLEAAEAQITELESRLIEVDRLTAIDMEAVNACIESLEATFGTFTDISTEDLDALNAEIGQLKAYTAEFTYVSTEVLEAVKASIKDLDVNKLSAEQADLKYANIDFSNIGEAAIEKIFSDSGIIKDLIVSEGKITGELVGVTIKGDLIEGGTVKADKLVVKGSDGLYYKLNVEAGAVESAEVTKEELQNGLHGTAIIAKTITAEKIAVDDLVAFGATIGGFHITSDSLYSGVKKSATNTTRGVYLDKDGQLSVGDADNFLRYYKTEDGSYRLEIAASSLVFGTSGKTVEEVIEDALVIEIGARNLIRNSKTLVFADYGFHSTVYPVDVNTSNGVLTLAAYPNSASTFAAEIIDGVITVTEQYETEATVGAKIVGDILSVN